MRKLKIAKSVKSEIYLIIQVRLFGLNKLDLNYKNMRKEQNKSFYKTGDNIQKADKLSKKLMPY